MEIKQKMVAVITYTLKDDDGTVIQAATEESPFAFIHGVGQVLPAFDAALLGKKMGDNYAFRLTAEEGYGVYNPEHVQELDAAIFEGAPAEYMYVGSTLPMDLGGQTVYGTISSITAEVVTMDFNHP